VLIGASSVPSWRMSCPRTRNTTFSAEELAAIDRDAVESGINLWAGSSAG
jgi:L-glyceraldehyde 3-phosphate reductase